jgi:hypothetical protein
MHKAVLWAWLLRGGRSVYDEERYNERRGSFTLGSKEHERLKIASREKSKVDLKGRRGCPIRSDGGGVGGGLPPSPSPALSFFVLPSVLEGL